MTIGYAGMNIAPDGVPLARISTLRVFLASNQTLRGITLKICRSARPPKACRLATTLRLDRVENLTAGLTTRQAVGSQQTDH